jgi:hypothetical protein
MVEGRKRERDNEGVCKKIGFMFVDTRRQAMAPTFCLFNKKGFFSIGGMKILLESSSSNLKELEIPN